MSDELIAAKLKIAELEEKLDKATTTKKTSEIEDKLTYALERLEAIEKRYKVPEKKEEPKEEEGEGNQCPECGCELIDIGNGVLECTGCGELWEDE